jgi:hypothetical protein
VSEKLLVPDIRRSIGDLARRIGILERRVSTAVSATGSPANDDIIFSYAGDLAATESPPVKLRYGGFFSTLSIALGTAGSTSTILEVKRNGSTVATITVPSSAADYGAAVGVRTFGEDRVSIEITTVGTGAADMTASARFT